MSPMLKLAGHGARSRRTKKVRGYWARSILAPICGERGGRGGEGFAGFPPGAGHSGQMAGNGAGRSIAGEHEAGQPRTVSRNGGIPPFLLGLLGFVAWRLSNGWARLAEFCGFWPDRRLIEHYPTRGLAVQLADQVAAGSAGGGIAAAEGGTPPMAAAPAPSTLAHAVFRILVPRSPGRSGPLPPWPQHAVGDRRKVQEDRKGSGVRVSRHDATDSAGSANSGRLGAGRGQRAGSVRSIAGNAGTLGRGVCHVNG